MTIQELGKIGPGNDRPGEDFNEGFTGQDPQQRRINEVEGGPLQKGLRTLFEKYSDFVNGVVDEVLGTRKSPEEMSEEEQQQVAGEIESRVGQGNAPQEVAEELGGGSPDEDAPSFLDRQTKGEEISSALDEIQAEETKQAQQFPYADMGEDITFELENDDLDPTEPFLQYHENTPPMQNSSVDRAKGWLGELGYDLSGSEGYDSNMAEAVKDLQQKAGFEPTGTIDNRTWELMKRESKNTSAGAR